MHCTDVLNNLQISEWVSIGHDSLCKWHTHFLSILSRLQEVRKQNPTKLESEVVTLLSDYVRPWQPPTYSDEPLLRLLELAYRNTDMRPSIGVWTSWWMQLVHYNCRLPHELTWVYKKPKTIGHPNIDLFFSLPIDNGLSRLLVKKL